MQQIDALAASRSRSEQRIREAFRASLLAKAAFATLEVLGGIGTYVVPQDFILRTIERFTRRELLEDPRDLVATHLVAWAHTLSLSSRHFAALYFVSHGAIKLWLVIGLLRGRMSYYPIAMAVFSAFAVYQLYRFDLTRSWWLLVITAIDVVVIVLTWHEYRQSSKP